MGKSILVVDDSDMMRKLIIKNLKNCGEDLQIHEARDGIHGLDKFNENTIDIIVTDWNMPNMTGLQLIEAIRKTDKGKMVPIVMITTEGSVEKVKQAVLAGASNYISKPFTPDSFRAKFAKILA